MFCHNCGREVPEGSSFCPSCGTRLADRATERTAEPSHREGGERTLLFSAKRSAWAYSKRLATCVLVAIVGLIFGIVAFASEIAPLGVILTIVMLAGIAAFVVTFFEAKHYEILFYEGRVVVKSGLFSTREDQSIMTPIIGVRVEQSLWGKIFNYGTVIIDKTGKGWDIATSYLKDPNKVKEFLEELISNTDFSRINMFLTN